MIDALKYERAFSLKSIMFISFYQYNINLHVFSSFAYSMPAQNSIPFNGTAFSIHKSMETDMQIIWQMRL